MHKRFALGEDPAVGVSQHSLALVSLLVFRPFLFAVRQSRAHPGAGYDLDYSEVGLSYGSWAHHEGGFHGRRGGF